MQKSTKINSLWEMWTNQENNDVLNWLRIIGKQVWVWSTWNEGAYNIFSGCCEEKHSKMMVTWPELLKRTQENQS